MPIKIFDRLVGRENPCFIIAEAGVNHNGRLDLALQLVHAASQAGADAVKFQTFRAEKVVTAGAPKADYQTTNTGSDESQLEMIRGLELSFKEFRQIYDCCQQHQILFLSTPFDAESADFLEEIGMAAFKIPSGELTNLPFLTHIASKRKPLIMSTGMADLDEVKEALETVRGAGNTEVVVLHCVSNYPAAPSSINLRAMRTMREELHLDVGFSDHTLGIEVALAAVAMGACVVEKHFTLDRALDGPDHKASLEPGELKEMIESIRNVEASLGDGVKRPAAAELSTAACARRSLVAACRIPAGVIITGEMVAILRPGTGMRPSLKSSILGRRSLVDLNEGDLFSIENLD